MLKKLAIAFAVLLVIGGAVVVYMARQATALPEWYQAEHAPRSIAQAPLDPTAPLQWISTPLEPADANDALGPPPPAPSVDDSPRATASPSKPAAKPGKTAKRHELRGFHHKATPSPAIKASRAVLEGDKLEAGLVVDLSKVSEDQLTPQGRDLLHRATQAFPRLTQRDVYVGIEDTPRSVDGVLQLGPNPQVRVGNLRYSLDAAAQKLGMNPTQLRTEINRELARSHIADPRVTP